LLTDLENRAFLGKFVMPKRPETPPQLLFLHSAATHCPTFRGLMAEESPALAYAEVVDADLLRDVMAAGALTPALEARLLAHLEAAKAEGVRAILCTCSTLGGPAERLGRGLGLVTLRIDRGMAEAAVAAGARILVLACIEATLGPTCDLLKEVAAAAGFDRDIGTALIPEAWDHFLAGAQARYLQSIADAIEAHDGSADVIVLAQASMADAADLCGPLRSRVLSSPRLGLRRALGALT